MSIKLITLVGAGALCFSCLGQQTFVNKEWDMANGSPGTYDHVSSALDPSGNLVYISNNLSGTNSDIFLNCIHPDGTIAWQQTCASSSTNDDYGADLVIDQAGNIYIAAAHHNGLNYDYLVAKYSATGSLIWQEFFDGPANGDDIPSAIILDSFGNLYVTGSATSSGMTDFATIKYDNLGGQQWVKYYDFSNKVEIATDIVVDNSGDIIVVGASAQNWLNSDIVVLKYSPSGTVLAAKRHNTPGNGYDLPSQMVVDSSGNIFVIGTADASANKDIKVIAYDPGLNIEWVEYVDKAGNTDEGFGIAVDSYGDVITTGYCTKASGGTEFIVSKYEGASGVRIWENIRSAPIATDIAKGRQVITDASDNIYALGEIELNGSREYALMLFESSGTLRYTGEYDVNHNDYPRQLLHSGSELYLTGISEGSLTKQVTTVKVSALDSDPKVVMCGADPCRVDDQILLRFNPQDLILSTVNDPDKTFGAVREYVKQSALDEIKAETGIVLDDLQCYKVHPKLTSSDTISTSRLGNVVKLPPFYATFGILLPKESDELQISNQLNTVPTHVLIATENGYATLDIGANDTFYIDGSSAGLAPTVSIPNANINIEPAWDFETGDPNVILGIYDSGINYGHDDISSGTFATSSVKDGFDYFNSSALTATPDPDNYGHGSAMAGLAAAWRNNSNGIAGVAGGPSGTGGISVHDMKIFDWVGPACTDVPLAAYNTILNAMIDGSANLTMPRQEVMNHSWKEQGNAHPLLREAFITAYDNEVILCASAGNSGNCVTVQYPSSNRDHMIMKIGANDASGARAGFSTCGFDLDFIAPGTNDLYECMGHNGSDFGDDQIWNSGSCVAACNGSSQAVPHVSGIASLMLSYANNNPLPNSFSHEDCEILMEKFATDLTAAPNTPGYDEETGHGRVNAGNVFNNILFPTFQVRHYSFTVPAASATLVGMHEKTCLEQSLFGLPVGITTVNRWEITASTSHTVPAGYGIIDGWARGSGSNTIPAIASTSNPVGPTFCNSSLLRQYLPSEKDAELNVFSLTGADMKGYIYELLDASLNTVGWWPFDPSNQATFAYTLYLSNQPLDVTEGNQSQFSLYPNPGNSMVTIQFSNNIDENVKIDLFDAEGQLVKVVATNQQVSKGTVVDFSVQDLASGLYLLRATAGNMYLTQKLSVHH